MRLEQVFRCCGMFFFLQRCAGVRVARLEYFLFLGGGGPRGPKCKQRKALELRISKASELAQAVGSMVDSSVGGEMERAASRRGKSCAGEKETGCLGIQVRGDKYGEFVPWEECRSLQFESRREV